MPDTPRPSDDEITVLAWTIPRPTGRWYQSTIVTARRVWITPELSHANNDLLLLAVDGGLDTFHSFIRSAGWQTSPQYCDLSEVRGVQWNHTTGWIRIAGAGEKVIGAMIPDRAAGTRLEPLLKRAIASRLPKRSGRS